MARESSAKISHFEDWVGTEPYGLGISKSEERCAVKRLLFIALFVGLSCFGLTSCGYQAPSTAVTCTTTTSTSSTTSSTSTCTDPVTNISVTISPATVSVNVATSQLFQDAIQGGTNSVAVWQVNGMTGGSDTIGKIDSNGLYHAPTIVPSPNTVSVTVASFEDPKVSATSTVTITPAPTVLITSPSAPVTVTSGTANIVNFSATETGGTTNTILWYVGPVGGLGVQGGNATLGTISASGVYSPPLTPPIGQTVTVTAAAQDSPTSTATLNVTISGYSTSSLQGQFTFSISGNSSGHFFRAGSFAADGAGNLNSVLEDINSVSGATTTPISTTGSYTVSADGRGSLKFSDGLTPANFDFVLVNGSQLQIIGFDASGTAAGQANAQVASTFTGTPLSALSGTYVFDFAGVHGSNGLSQVGEFSADGAGNITDGSIDINDGGTLSQFQIFGSKTSCTPPPPPPPPPLPPSSLYSISSNGRGTLTLHTINASCAAGPSFTLTFYVTTRGGAKFVGADTVLQVGGFTSQQAPNAALDVSALNGNFAFLLAGSGLGGTIATAGNFSADGTGCLTPSTGVLDENVSGAVTLAVPFLPLPLSDPACPGDAGKYTVALNGRGTLTFLTAGRTHTFVFYVGPVGTNTTAVLQETDSGIASDGNFTLQQSPAFTLASIQGNYAIETSGVSGASLQVTTGQLAADSKGAVTSGSLDTNTAGSLASGQPVTGSYSAPAATGRATLTLNSGALNYAAYVVSPTQVYILGIKSGQLAVGALLRQF
jgi:hypothetical protein